MSTGTPTDRETTSAKEIADRHGQLHDRAAALDAVDRIDTTFDGPRTARETPGFETELVIDSEHDVVPPTVLEAIAECDLGIAAADPQGDQLIVTVS